MKSQDCTTAESLRATGKRETYFVVNWNAADLADLDEFVPSLITAAVDRHDGLVRHLPVEHLVDRQPQERPRRVHRVQGVILAGG